MKVHFPTAQTVKGGTFSFDEKQPAKRAKTKIIDECGDTYAKAAGTVKGAKSDDDAILFPSL